jgi:hypothetical protein
MLRSYHRSVCLALLLTAGGQALAPGVVEDWFPVHVGDKWVFEHTSSDDNGEGRGHLEVHAWRTEETTVAIRVIPEGTVVEAHVRVLQGTPRGDVSSSEIYLIRGNCIYGPGYGGAAWNARTHTLTQDFSKGLRTYSSPDFCFPLVLHKTWGAPHGLPDWNAARPEDARDWEVVGTRRGGALALHGRSAYHITSISAYPGSGETVDIWFEKGIGVVEEYEVHHGTVGQQRDRLVSFTPAK